MSNALIGYTGFVGSNLAQQVKFDYLFNSANIREIAGKKFNTLICAGVPAEKWKANQAPEKDLENIAQLVECLKLVETEQLILISTVDVYPDPVAVDEETEIEMAKQHPYGANRYWLEAFVKNHFKSLIVRLPGLFGIGLKKNIIFDLLHNNQVAAIHSENIYQFYSLDNLWTHIQIALNHNLALINLVTEPVSVSEVASNAFGVEFHNCPHNNPVCYDVRTRHASCYTSNTNYIYCKDEILAQLGHFVQHQREAKV